MRIGFLLYFDDDKKAILADAGAPGGVADSVFTGHSGKTESKKKKDIADGVYQRLCELYPDMRRVNTPDRMLARWCVPRLGLQERNQHYDC